MKKINKILVLVFLLLITVVLVSCGQKTPQINGFYVDGLSDDLTFVDEFTETNNIDVNVNFWIILEDGTSVSYETEKGKIVLAEEQTDSLGINIGVENVTVDGNVRTLTLKYTDNLNRSKTTSFKQYLKGTTDEVVGIAANYDARALTHHQGYSFDGSGITVYELKANGESSVIDHSDVVFVGGDYHPRGSDTGKSYLNNVNVDVKITYENFEIPFTVRIAGGQKPIHYRTATFWNWIFLQMPIAFAMSFFAGITGKSLAWGIVLTTILVRTLAWPIYAKTNDMSMKMALAQPDMQRVQSKYATRKDPESQQKMQMELMGVYKKHNINMLGCFLPILQMPIFLAMFQVVSRIAIPGGQFYENVVHTKFLGMDLSSSETTWVNFVFAGIVGITMFLLQKISAKKPSYAKQTGTQNVANPQQAQSEQTMKMVSYFMIIMMVFASFATVSLAFYWIVGNVFSIGQTLVNRHLSEVKYKKMEDEKLYGKGNVIDAKFKSKGDK